MLVFCAWCHICSTDDPEREWQSRLAHLQNHRPQHQLHSVYFSCGTSLTAHIHKIQDVIVNTGAAGQTMRPNNTSHLHTNSHTEKWRMFSNLKPGLAATEVTCQKQHTLPDQHTVLYSIVQIYNCSPLKVLLIPTEPDICLCCDVYSVIQLLPNSFLSVSIKDLHCKIFAMG